jgi:flavin-dependent halogenase
MLHSADGAHGVSSNKSAPGFRSGGTVTSAESIPDVDVIVIGGGPAGSATAGLLAQRGRSVLLIEREKFPRYHIGESFLTGGLWTLRDLGILDRVDGASFMRKYGGTFRWGADGDLWDFRFKDFAKWDYSWQVRRADFDALLLARARELGVTVLEEATVSDVIQENGRVTGVIYSRRSEGTAVAARSSFVVDATGQAHLLARRFGLLRWHEHLRNMAVWAYFQGCDRYDGTRAGDIVVEHLPEGWFWLIPLMDGTTSIGYVTPVAALRQDGAEGAGLRDLFEAQLPRTTEIHSLVKGATRVSDYRTARDWSYSSQRMFGPGWALAGDAAAFIDPLMSTGITVALRSARGLAAALDWMLTHPDSTVPLERYEAALGDFVALLIKWVTFFYDGNRRREDYYEKARDLVDPTGTVPVHDGFVTLLSGLYGLFADLGALTRDIEP